MSTLRQNYCQTKTIAIIGFGQIGQALLTLSKKIYPCHRYLIIDLNHQAVDGVEFYQRDVTDESLQDLLSEVDLIVSCLPWWPHLALLNECFKLSTPVFGLARPNYECIEELELAAGASSTMMLNGCGLEPGLSEILCNYAASFYQSIDSVGIYCGGMPLEPRAPMGHRLTFDAKHLPFAKRDTYCITQTKLEKVERFSGLEQLNLEGIGVFEAFHDGLPPWRNEFAKQYSISEYTQKTLRWPGYAAVVNFLHDAGFLEESSSLTIEDNVISYRDLIEKKLMPQLKPSVDDADMTLLFIKLTGVFRNEGDTTETTLLLRCESDQSENTSSMAKMTTLPLLFMMNKWAEKAECVPIYKPEKYITVSDTEALLKLLQENGVTISSSQRALV